MEATPRQTAAIHGLDKQAISRANLTRAFADVYNLVVRQKDNKDSLIRRTVINLLPMLARFNPEQFCERYLTDSINHLIMILRKGSERSSPYLALGAIVSIAGQRVRCRIHVFLHLGLWASWRVQLQGGGSEPPLATGYCACSY